MEPLEGPESIGVEEIEAAFNGLERQDPNLGVIDPILSGDRIEAREHYHLAGMDMVEKGIVPPVLQEDIHTHRNGQGGSTVWSVAELMESSGF